MRVKHHGILQGYTHMGQPGLQPRCVGFCLQILPDIDIKGGGCHHHGSALHQKLIDGKDLFLVEIFRCHDHEQVGLGWYMALF